MPGTTYNREQVKAPVQEKKRNMTKKISMTNAGNGKENVNPDGSSKL